MMIKDLSSSIFLETPFCHTLLEWQLPAEGFPAGIETLRNSGRKIIPVFIGEATMELIRTLQQQVDLAFIDDWTASRHRVMQVERAKVGCYLIETPALTDCSSS